MCNDNEKYTDSDGRINQRKLFDNLYPGRVSPRVRAVSTPNARTSKECDEGSNQLPSIEEISARVDKLKYIDRKVWYIAEIQLMNAMRISEVLQLKSVDITKIGSFKIRALKGSQDRMGVCANAREYLLKCRKVPVDPFKELDRFYVYRCYRKVGLYGYVNDGNHRVVTHIFRHLAAESANQGGISLNTIQKQLGHKNQKSTSHYVKEAKE